MSMTLYAVISLTCGVTTANLNIHAENLAVPIKFIHKVDLAHHSGYLPVQLNGNATGVETYFENGLESIQRFTSAKTGSEDKTAAVVFRWGGDFREGATAFYMGYILAKKCDAKLFESESGTNISTEEALQGAQMMSLM